MPLSTACISCAPLPGSKSAIGALPAPAAALRKFIGYIVRPFGQCAIYLRPFRAALRFMVRHISVLVIS